MPPVISCVPSCYGRFGACAAIENLRAAGLEYIELPIRTAGRANRFGDEPLVTTASTPDDLRRVEALLETNRVRISSCNVLSGNPLDDETLAIVLRKLDLAGHFGATLVVGDAGEARTPHELDKLDGHLRTIGDHAGRLGITYCFETHPGLCRDHHAMLDTMAALDHPHLKLNFDTGNLLYYNGPVVVETALARVAHHVMHMHLKDHSGVAGQWYFPALGLGGGAMDLVAILGVMRSCGFRGPYSIEIGGIEGEGELTLKQYQRRVKDSVNHLKVCGYFS